MSYNSKTCGQCRYLNNAECVNEGSILFGLRSNSEDPACLMWQPIDDDFVEKDERELFYAVSDRGGSFYSKLFKLVCAADLQNQARLKRAFPGFVTAAQRYQNERGYWENLQKRMVSKR